MDNHVMDDNIRKQIKKIIYEELVPDMLKDMESCPELNETRRRIMGIILGDGRQSQIQVLLTTNEKDLIELEPVVPRCSPDHC